jgi:hypothetical protein
MRLTRRRVLFLLAALLLPPVVYGGVVLPTYPLRDTDQEEATRLIVAWAVNGTPLPGTSVEFAEGHRLRDGKRIIVVCDDLAADAKLSDDPRVVRMHSKQVEPNVGEREFLVDSYLVIAQARENQFLMLMRVTPGVDPPAKQYYQVTVRRRLWGLELRVEPVAISRW